MIQEIIKFAKEFINLPKNVKDTAGALSRGDLAGMATAYAKSIPGALTASKLAVPATKGLASVFSTTLGGRIASNTLVQSGQSLSKAASWWLQPARAAGTVTKTASVNLAKKVGISTLGKVGVAGAVIGGEHLLSKITNSPSTITYLGAIFNDKIRDKVLDGERPQTFLQKMGDFMIAGPQRRGVLKVIRKIKGGNK